MRPLKSVVIAVLLVQMVAARAGAELPIVDRPIGFDALRKRLTLEYRRRHQGIEEPTLEIVPKVIVIHHTGTRTLEAAWRIFDRSTIDENRRMVADAGQLNVSAHFLVDRDGTIYRLMPETTMARHCIGLNHISLAIENVGDGTKHPLTKAQLRANAALVRHLVGRFPITHLIGHHEYQSLEAHPYFLERDPSYRTKKNDPGPTFMRQLLARVRDLGLSTGSASAGR